AVRRLLCDAACGRHRNRSAKTAGDRLSEREKPVEQRRAKEWIVDEVMPDAVDVRIDHQSVDEPEDQHDPKRCVRVEQEKREEIHKMKQPGQRRNRVPAGVRKQFGIGRGTIYSDRVSGSHGTNWGL
ncbi:MAG: hypothetical protein JWO45_1139, partial [Spartobacteria bacterium]|nr:hypothetical protein [Spartobacteria bacterium]